MLHTYEVICGFYYIYKSPMLESQMAKMEMKWKPCFHKGLQWIITNIVVLGS